MPDQDSAPDAAEEQRKQKAREAARRRYHANREQQLERLKKWAAENPEKRRAYQKKWLEENREAKIEYNREYQRKNRDRFRAQKKDGELRRQYGISLAEYNAMLDEQGHACAICKAVPKAGDKALHVDHCHASGAVRGLLCSGCNTALGLLGDDVDRLRDAIRYLSPRKDLT